MAGTESLIGMSQDRSHSKERLAPPKGVPESGLLLEDRSKPKKPSLYKVVLLNDDYTPMEFVVHVLETLFNKSREEATAVMLNVHRKGVGICGIYPFEIAETKAGQLLHLAREHEHPLQCRVEED